MKVDKCQNVINYFVYLHIVYLTMPEELQDLFGCKTVYVFWKEITVLEEYLASISQVI